MSIWMKIKEGARTIIQRMSKSPDNRTSTEHGGEEEQKKDFFNRNFVFMRRKPGYLVSVLATTLLFFLIFAMMVGVAGVGAFLGVARGYLDATPELDLADIENQSETSFIYDRNGNLVSEYYGLENRESVSIKEIPEMLQNAFIAIEDVRFRAHNGIDIKRLFGAVIHNLSNDSVQGGSTITQQLIKQTILTPEQSYKRKIQEMYLAMELEKIYTKDQILEAYLNMIPLGGSSYGIKAAAQDYFGKELNELTLQECAMLAGITRNPWKYDPRKNIYERGPEYELETCKRTNLVLHEMYENGFITLEQYEEAKFDTENLANNTYTVLEKGTSNDYPMKYFLEYAVKEVQEQLMKSNGMTAAEATNLIYSGGLNIYTTLDTDIQAAAEEAVYNYEKLPRFRDSSDAISKNGVPQPQAAAMVMDHSTGEIRAIVGGKQPPTGKKQLNRVTSRLAMGSAIKPLSVYGPFIELKYPGGILFENIPTDIEGWQGEERNYPYNYSGEGDFTGPVTVRQAIRKSLNVVAAQIVCERITPQYSAETLINLGFDPSNVTENPSDLALGTHGNSMVEAIGAYGTIANKGVYLEPISVLRVTDRNGKEILNRNNQIKRQVFKESTTFILTEWMQEVVQGGTTTISLKNEAGERIPVAGKTGTNNDFRGVYFAGFTPDLVATVWIGHDDFSPEFVSGSTGGVYAAPLWTEIMTAAHKNTEPQNFYDEVPSDIKRVTACGLTGKAIVQGLCDADTTYPPVTEWFPQGAAPSPEDSTQVCDMHMGARICTYSGYPAGEYCPQEAIADRPMIVLTENSRYQKLDDAKLAQYLPGAVRSYEQVGYSTSPDMQQTCPLHDYDWWRREQRRQDLRGDAKDLIDMVKGYMKSSSYGAMMTSAEKKDLNKLIDQLEELLESGNKGPPGPGEPYLTELPKFDVDAVEKKMDQLRERLDEILDRIDLEASTYHTLAISISGEGSVKGAGKYPEGEKITISAKADTGWKFSTWLGPVDDPYDASTTITMGGSDIYITAVFVKDGTHSPSPSPSLSPTPSPSP